MCGCHGAGIGYEVAKGMAMMGAKVILAVRTEERGKSVSCRLLTSNVCMQLHVF